MKNLKYLRTILMLIPITALLWIYSTYSTYRAELLKHVPHQETFPAEVAPHLNEALKFTGELGIDPIRPGHFSNMPLKKQKHLRIGFFGDSFTFGDEAPANQNFPNFFEVLARQNGYDIEIINFGRGWSGTTQSFYLWDKVKELYNLDASVFGPSGWFIDRNLSFNHTRDYQPYYMHGRILKNKDGQFEYLYPIGDNPDERTKKYYRLIPPWLYWRYDTNPPSIARMWFTKAGLVWPRNAFYHRRDMHQELHEIHEYIINQIRAYSKPNVIFAFTSLFPELSQEFIDRAHLDRIPFCMGFPDKAMGHCSAIGYLHVANNLFNSIAANKKYSRIKYYFKINNQTKAAGLNEPIKTSDIKNLIFNIGDYAIAEPFTQTPSGPRQFNNFTDLDGHLGILVFRENKLDAEQPQAKAVRISIFSYKESLDVFLKSTKIENSCQRNVKYLSGLPIVEVHCNNLNEHLEMQNSFPMIAKLKNANDALKYLAQNKMNLNLQISFDQNQTPININIGHLNREEELTSYPQNTNAFGDLFQSAKRK